MKMENILGKPDHKIYMPDKQEDYYKLKLYINTKTSERRLCLRGKELDLAQLAILNQLINTIITEKSL